MCNVMRMQKLPHKILKPTFPLKQKKCFSRKFHFHHPKQHRKLLMKIRNESKWENETQKLFAEVGINGEMFMNTWLSFLFSF